MWLALLALGVQIVLPLSVGAAISRQGAAAEWQATIAANLCVADTSRAAGDSGSGTNIPHGDNSDGGCPLCMALQVMHAFTEASALALPTPSVVGQSPPFATDNAVIPAPPFASYQPRAPPVTA